MCFTDEGGYFTWFILDIDDRNDSVTKELFESCTVTTKCGSLSNVCAF